jgi:hypothetical protein
MGRSTAPNDPCAAHGFDTAVRLANATSKLPARDHGGPVSKLCFFRLVHFLPSPFATRRTVLAPSASKRMASNPLATCMADVIPKVTALVPFISQMCPFVPYALRLFFLFSASPCHTLCNWCRCAHRSSIPKQMACIYPAYPFVNEKTSRPLSLVVGYSRIKIKKTYNGILYTPKKDK